MFFTGIASVASKAGMNSVVSHRNQFDIMLLTGSVCECFSQHFCISVFPDTADKYNDLAHLILRMF